MLRESGLPRIVTDARTDADGITLRRVATLDEYQTCVAIQEATWGVGFRELVPTAILMVAQKLGGVCAAAFDADGHMLGFVFGLTGIRDGVLVHWSDLLAVRPAARGAHLGERLKRYQRELVLAVGVRTMYWTFDPLVARAPSSDEAAVTWRTDAPGRSGLNPGYASRASRWSGRQSPLSTRWSRKTRHRGSSPGCEAADLKIAQPQTTIAAD